ncbi:MAG: PCP reductase family protein [Betaproteobacteria bacterium]|nr:PCP reductase family protein [Betaproteobacteria bacterium]
MKFLCVACDEAMKLVDTGEVSPGDAFTAVFRCPRCGARTALLANPWETQLVRSLGVSLGGRAAPHEPLELVRDRLVESRLLWTGEAERRLERVPEFVRPMVRDSVERHARERGCREVTCEVMDEVRSQMGM